MRFTIWLTPGSIPERYADCIASQHLHTPDLVVVRDWPAEIAEYRTGNDRLDSDALRVYLLSLEDGEYRDADCTQSAPVDMPIMPTAAACYVLPDIWYLAGPREFFAEMWKWYVETKPASIRWACEYLKDHLSEIILYSGSDLKHLNLSRGK